MTIKPIAKPRDGKKDSHGHNRGESPIQNVHSAHRNFDNNAAQSPSRRGDIFEEIARQRHKSRSKQLKRERERERERDRENLTANLQRCQPPLEREQQLTLSQTQPPLVDATTSNLIRAVEDAYSGYNSGDEHLRNREEFITADEWRRRDGQFEKLMSEQGFILQSIEEDGACLFRAISLQIYGDEEMHDQIRQQTMDYLYKNREYYSQFLTEDVNSYIKRKRKRDAHGNHIEIQLMSELYNRPIELYCYKPRPINIFNSEQQDNGYPPLRLAYVRGSHYNAIIDPFNATVGVGLGLAGYKPGLQTKDAMVLSEQLEIEQTMFEDKLKATDWEATNEAIEEQIARESYLQWCRDNMHPKTSHSEPETIQENCASGSGSAAAAGTAAVSSTATVTSTETAVDVDDASSSKHHLQQTRTSTVTNDNVDSSTASTSSGNSVPVVRASSPASVDTSATAAANAGNLSSQSLTAFGQSLQKDSELRFNDSDDDTDLSSNSSIDHSGDRGASRGRKSKNRDASSRLSKRRRQEVAAVAAELTTEEKENEEIESLTTPKGKDGTVGNTCDSEAEKQASSSSTLIECSNGKDSGKSPEHKSVKDEQHLSPSDSPPAISSPVTFASPDTSKQIVNKNFLSAPSPTNSPTSQQPVLVKPKAEKPVSTFYESLLESSFVADGFGQLSETELLQQAIQLSTQEYLEDQKRKGGFLF